MVKASVLVTELYGHTRVTVPETARDKRSGRLGSSCAIGVAVRPSRANPVLVELMLVFDVKGANAEGKSHRNVESDETPVVSDTEVI